MWQYNYSDELYHYGVLGMKWGVRKARQEVKGEIKRLKKDYKNASTDNEKASAKQALKDYKNMGRTKGQRIADNLVNKKDVQAYMSKGESHAKAFCRALGDRAIKAGAITVLAAVGVKKLAPVVSNAVSNISKAAEGASIAGNIYKILTDFD